MGRSGAELKKHKIAVILGTRPEVIKMAPVISAFRGYKSRINLKIILTGQHRRMVDQLLKVFSLKADYDLKVMRRDQTICDVSRRCLGGLSKALEKEKPDLLLVEGDTTTAVISALCAFYHKIAVGHVEAGLRTYDKFHPFPEEKNRQAITALSDIHFAPTKKAKQNLLKENIPASRIFLTGNTVIDALYAAAKQAREFSLPALRRIDFENRKVILVTAHRRENFGKPFEEICGALVKISKISGVEIIYPVHLNPRVRGPVRRILGKSANIHLLEPLAYPDFVRVLKKCFLVMTDSGGVQEEAPAFGKPLLVMRKVTERPEGVESGVARLIGVEEKNIVIQAGKLLTDKNAYNEMSRAVNPYGDGHAAERIVKACLEFLKKSENIR